MPYKPASLDTSESDAHDPHLGDASTASSPARRRVAPSDWAWAKCDADEYLPRHAGSDADLPQGWLRSGLLYQVVFTAKDPYVLGVGFAAFRDISSFFKYAAPGRCRHAPTRRRRHHLGDQARHVAVGQLPAGLHPPRLQPGRSGAQVYDGAWPIIAGRRIALNFRFASPTACSSSTSPAAKARSGGRRYADAIRGLPRAASSTAAMRRNTCPKIIEHFGAAEIWGLKLRPNGSAPTAKQTFRCRTMCGATTLPSTQHGGGAAGSDSARAPPACPASARHGRRCRQSDAAHRDGERAPRAFPQLGDEGHAPPPSRYPTLREGELVDADQGSHGLSGHPGVPPTRADRPHQPAARLRLRPGFNYDDGAGVSHERRRASSTSSR